MVAMTRQAAISKSVMPVSSSALPCTNCCQSTMTARVGAARKNVLIQPPRTEVSTSKSAPKMMPSRQAVSLVLSDMIRMCRPQRTQSSQRNLYARFCVLCGESS